MYVYCIYIQHMCVYLNHRQKEKKEAATGEGEKGEMARYQPIFQRQRKRAPGLGESVHADTGPIAWISPAVLIFSLPATLGS